LNEHHPDPDSTVSITVSAIALQTIVQTAASKPQRAGNPRAANSKTLKKTGSLPVQSLGR